MGFFSNFSNKTRVIYLQHMLQERAVALSSECTRRNLGESVQQACSKLLEAADQDLRNLGVDRQISTIETMLAKADMNRNADLVGSTAIFLVGVWLESLARAKAHPDWDDDYMPIAEESERHLLKAVKFRTQEYELMERLFDLIAPQYLVSARAEGRRRAKLDEKRRTETDSSDDDIPF